MKSLVKSLFVASLVGLIGFSLTAIAQERTIDGVVVSKNASKNTITVKGDVSGQRHTYFIEDSTKLMSQGKTISFSEIKRGQKVSLAFRQTDQGRELLTFRVPNLDDLIAVIPIEIDEEFTISGTITGVRPIRRTISIRGEDRTEQITLHVPEGTKITRNGKPVRIGKLLKDDKATFRYNITEDGYILVSGRAPKVVLVSETVEQNEEAVPMLPKTASDNFAWLLAALGLFMTAGLVNLARRRTS